MLQACRMPNAEHPLINFHEFGRFIVTGVVATLGNVATVASLRAVMVYPFALLAGLTVGFAVSFSVGKLFAFRSRSLRGTSGELARFLMVYAFGAAIFWAIGMVVGLKLAPRFMPPKWAEVLGVLAGASVMMVTSYLGHRWFTYAHRREATMAQRPL